MCAKLSLVPRKGRLEWEFDNRYFSGKSLALHQYSDLTGFLNLRALQLETKSSQEAALSLHLQQSENK